MIFQVHLFLQLNQKVVNGLICMKFGIMPIHGGSGELKGFDFSKVVPLYKITRIEGLKVGRHVKLL